jgi:hypothetical protein
MPVRSHVLLATILGLMLAAGPGASQPTEAPALSVKLLMKHVVNPAAEAFWKSSGSVSTEGGTEARAPTSDAAWTAMIDNAAVVLEGGNLLALPGRGPADPRWTRFARQLADAGAQGMAAAGSKDPDKVFEAGGAMYEACFACHRAFIPRRGEAPLPLLPIEP